MVEDVDMAVVDFSKTRVPVALDIKSRTNPTGSAYLDLISAVLSLWLIAGLYLDGSAHHHIPDLIETFFTPWHAVLYLGLLANVVWLGIQQWRNVAKGYAWSRALPKGYRLSIIGAGIFMFGGVADLLWHTAFGFEVGLEALVSPSHLVLAVGGALIVTGPLRSALHRLQSQPRLGWRDGLPVVLSLMTVMSILTFFTGDFTIITYPNFMVHGPTSGSTFYQDIHALASVVIPALIVSGVLLFAIPRWTLPVGSLTVILVGNTLLMSWFHLKEVYPYPQTVLAVVVAALIAEALYRRLKPSITNTTALRVFSFAVPAVLFAAFFINLLTTAGIWWSIHKWAGSIFYAGGAGLLLSYLITPTAKANGIER
jgi:hypothetical protein